MSRQYISMDNLMFLIHEVHSIKDLFKYPRFSHLGEEEMNMLIQAAKDIADKDFFPYFREMDDKPVVYEQGKVKSHPQLKKIFEVCAEGGWIGGPADFDNGGMQLPQSIYFIAQQILQAANSSGQGYIALTSGSAGLITKFGSRELIDTYVPQMFEGKWQGTMALTEPQAGSALSDITTSAKPTKDDYFEIVGQKIFISGGDHEACENFIHLTLARIAGAPAGTKGISLFVIPKYIPKEDGDMEYNNVVCAGDFQKMGQRGYSTTHLVFGDTGVTKGFLVGEENKGLLYMFQMMNEARIGVGQTAAAIASAAYYASLEYAMERPQGRKIEDKDMSKPATLIINHADVRRMLLQQKAIVEGSISLGVECLKLVDLEHVLDGEEKENANLLLEILTPIMKTYPSEMGIQSVSNALQVLGGYGFTMDFDLQQYYRDIRITAIYEGTTGIQSMDLLGRKVTMNQGKALNLLLETINKSISQAKIYDGLKVYADELQFEVKRLGTVLEHLMHFAKKGEVERYLSDATVFMEQASLVVLAWQWIKMSIIAHQALLKGGLDHKKEAFYESNMHTMKFFFKYELAKTQSLAKTIMHPDSLTIRKEKEVLI